MSASVKEKESVSEKYINKAKKRAKGKPKCVPKVVVVVVEICYLPVFVLEFKIYANTTEKSFLIKHTKAKRMEN